MAVMGTTYETALEALYRAPLRSFVSERKRLAQELKATGDASGSARLAKRGRPSLSAWAVNQLWWHARPHFDELFRTAESLRSGDLSATAAHREAIVELRVCAAALLAEAGHPATEATLRRVTTTLSALAASGGFDPESPGTLAADRDPPGFGALGIGSSKPEPAPDRSAAPVPAKAAAAKAPAPAKASARREELAERAREQAEQARERELAAEERERLEQEQEALRAERQRLEAALRTAKREVQSRARGVADKTKDIDEQGRLLERLRSELEQARAGLEAAENEVQKLEAKLGELT